MGPVKYKNMYGWIFTDEFEDIFGKRYPTELYDGWTACSIYDLWKECERVSALGWKAYPCGVEEEN